MTRFSSLFNRSAWVRLCVGVLLVGVVWVCASALWATAETTDSCEVYALICEVVEVDRTTDTVTAQDFNGNLWAFSGCDDWAEGDSCGMVMNTMGTTSIYDDEIENVKYGGWSLVDWRE